MQSTASQLRDAFWASPPRLPGGLCLERLEPIVIARPGRAGVAIYDLLALTGPGVRLTLIAGYHARLLAGELPKLKRQLVELADQRRTREPATGGIAGLVSTLITDVAKPSVVEACQRAGIALVDQRGTCIIHAPGVLVHVEGKGVVERSSRIRLFSGKASRVVRLLLGRVAFEPTAVPRSAQQFAQACDLSYAYTHGVLTALEKRGFVDRKSTHSGFRLRDPVGLLRAWIDSNEQTAVATEGFYAPATTPEALATGARRLAERAGTPALFTLASALAPSDLHVAALPHGVYWTGELGAAIDALGLRRTTPHNFLVLRPDPLVWTEAGGLLVAGTDFGPDVGAFRCVPLAQVAADFAALPGRGRDQAEFLVEAYAKRLPYRLDAT